MSERITRKNKAESEMDELKQMIQQIITAQNEVKEEITKLREGIKTKEEEWKN